MAEQLPWDEFDEAGIFTAWDEETLAVDDRLLEAEIEAVEMEADSYDDDSEADEHDDEERWAMFAELRRMGVVRKW
jgi:hypothetical protein